MIHFKDKYSISTDKSDVNIVELHKFLSERSYWAKNIPIELVKKGIENSVCFSVLNKTNQFIGFARVITDLATFGYLADVYINEEHQGKGLGKWLIEVIMNYEDFKWFRNWILFTKDAQSLYEKHGWSNLENAERIMVIRNNAQELYSNYIK